MLNIVLIINLAAGYSGWIPLPFRIQEIRKFKLGIFEDYIIDTDPVC